MAGNTAIIDQQTLRLQWLSYQPLGEIAQFWSVSSHQLIRLRTVWQLPPRNDRRRRYKPSRDERMLDPSPEELAASERSLDLAPQVAARVTCVQITWSDTVRADRLATKSEPLSLAPMSLPEELGDEEGDEW